ncbi:hypothetical protein TCAL_10023 [Tigriopus californicus]|uniref:Aspartate dehydrogenase domain-containing protein n=1 Tax=Tigriopus californicus TaxID=6832 RepID=A0A553NX26_TIGCA|nr:aspartate dehydrogenase domain-containing protein-like [Tigriopus californicus]TRY69983.1 hypothetical protein TCAL_10023 [Tigriopus californicus]
MRRIGIVGYGHLGQYLTQAIQESNDLELAFVWNRTMDLLTQEAKIPSDLVMRDLRQASEYKPDLIVEVSHPSVTFKHGEYFLQVCDFMIGSPTALADPALEAKLKAKALEHGHGLYVPSGALWGGEDIRKMADRGTLKGLCVTMRKHPTSFKIDGQLRALNEQAKDASVTLYHGPVRALCPLAPNNVNTMAAAAIAAHNLGFDGVQGRLISDPSLSDWHVVEVSVEGPEMHGQRFKVDTIRRNPAAIGAVSGSATYASFFSSTLLAHGKGAGVFLC